MAGGNLRTSSNEVIENDDEGDRSDFDDARKVNSESNPLSKSGRGDLHLHLHLELG